jgi:hypothetical protein
VADEPAAVLDGLRAGRVAISARRDRPVLLKSDSELIAVRAERACGPGRHARARTGNRALNGLPVTEGRQVRLLITAFPTGVSFIDHEYATGPAGPL